MNKVVTKEHLIENLVMYVCMYTTLQGMLPNVSMICLSNEFEP
jgi:hypothetical protein